MKPNNIRELMRAGEHKAYYVTIDGVLHDRRCLDAADRIEELEMLVEKQHKLLKQDRRDFDAILSYSSRPVITTLANNAITRLKEYFDG